METRNEKDNLNQLPSCAIEYIHKVVSKMRYRKKVRNDVQEELTAHFEDELRDCKEDTEKEQRALQVISDFGDAKLLGLLLRRAKKRCRPLWLKTILRTAQVMGIIILYYIIVTSLLFIGKPTIKIDYVQWMNEKNRAGRDEADNACSYYDKAAATYQPMPKWLVESTVKWPADFDDSELKSFTEWLTSNKETFETFRKAAGHLYYWRRYLRTRDSNNAYAVLTQDVMPDIMRPLPDYKQLAYAVRWQIRYEAYTSDVNQAMQDCLSLVKFGYDMQSNGFLIEELVGVAIEAVGLQECSRILEKVNVSPTVLDGMRKRFEILYEKDKPVISSDSEKVFWYDIVQQGFTDDGKGDGRLLIKALPYVLTNTLSYLKMLLLFDYPSRKKTLATIEQYFSRISELNTKTPWQLHNEGIDANNWDKDISNKSIMLDLEGRSLYKVGKTGWQHKTARSALLTILALSQYKNEKGQYPEELSELVSTGYLKQLPQDPYSNDSFKYFKDGSNFTLYSVGSNFRDDGGQISTDSRGVPKNFQDNGDWIFWPVQ
jgi:hypothetical protein